MYLYMYMQIDYMMDVMNAESILLMRHDQISLETMILKSIDFPRWINNYIYTDFNNRDL